MVEEINSYMLLSGEETSWVTTRDPHSFMPLDYISILAVSEERKAIDRQGGDGAVEQSRCQIGGTGQEVETEIESLPYS